MIQCNQCSAANCVLADRPDGVAAHAYHAAALPPCCMQDTAAGFKAYNFYGFGRMKNGTTQWDGGFLHRLNLIQFVFDAVPSE
jgi:hypothetical protein